MLSSGVLVRSSILFNHQGNGAQARSLITEALTLFEQMGDGKNLAFATGYLGVITLEEGDYALAQTLFEKALFLARQSGEAWSAAMAFSYMGRVALEQGEHAKGIALCEESLALNQERGERLIIAHTFRNMGDGWLYHGDYTRAAACYQQSIAIQQSWGLGIQRRGMELSLGGLGWTAFACQDYAQACSYWQEGLKMAYDMGAKRGVARCLEGLAALVSEQGAGRQAARLFGMAETVRLRVKAPLPPAARPLYDANVARVRAQLNEATFVGVWDEGRHMLLEQAVTEALTIGQYM